MDRGDQLLGRHGFQTLIEKSHALLDQTFGASQTDTALVGKQLGVRPDGWEKAAGDYAETGSFRSVADVVDAESLEKVRSFKKAAKSAAKLGA